MSFAIGSLVTVRGRDWVVLPESEPQNKLLVVRPLGGSDEEITGIYLPLEPVEPSGFPPPDPGKDLGNHADSKLLRDAVRLGFRSAAGPFRCLARIAVEPRPYQMVPLLMALRQEPVRLLIADDVGIGKTVEALLIARELLDRGEIRRIAVLCPPHLAEQWQRAMSSQFHIEAALVLPSTARRLERGLAPGESLFDRHPHVVISMDWIKSEHRRPEFLRACPEFVIVDEAHTCTSGDSIGRSSQQRHDLLRELVKDESRHLLLVTATPHSGKEEHFRSLLGLLDPGLKALPEDLSREENRRHRERLARYLVQRRRGHLRAFLSEDTPFPDREIAEQQYTLSEAYKAFLENILDWCKERVFDPELDQRRQRIQWWSALALLRAIGSSPAAAAATLRNRAANAEAATVEEADDIGRRQILDLEDELVEGIDVVPGSQTEEADNPHSARLKQLAKEADGLKGAEDQKLKRAAELTQELLKDGFSPILFCRFIPTVEYLAVHLRSVLPEGVEVIDVTGNLHPEEREKRVQDAQQHPRRVLVCTDCLSEGINLQSGFDAVIHYDLAWNPTRHEQREGRVDRYGQPKELVRTLTFYGRNNPVDGMILDVLLRKHNTIHKKLGITVPVPVDSNAVVEAMMEALLLRRRDTASTSEQVPLPFKAQELDVQWTDAAEREERSRTLFAQASIKVEEVQRELQAARTALGTATDVEEFVREALSRTGVPVSSGTPLQADLAGSPSGLRDAVGVDGLIRLSFRPPVAPGAVLATRTHPFVAGLSSHVLESALDPLRAAAQGSPARRCSAVETRAVTQRTNLILLRLRFHIISRTPSGGQQSLLAEDVGLFAFTGPARAPVWLPEDTVEVLLQATPSANMADEVKRHHIQRLISKIPDLQPHLDALAGERGEVLLEAHRRVRKAGKLALRALRVDPYLPVDLLGLVVLMPGGAR